MLSDIGVENQLPLSIDSALAPLKQQNNSGTCIFMDTTTFHVCALCHGRTRSGHCRDATCLFCLRVYVENVVWRNGN